ncbi:bifunctional NAD(P)H-hydrate repair enzyme Nnr [Marinobacterium nitratireducens]|uniref:Bifunctional NAD(P)H-hydrate repair enzyme n=1 Tax=Marinobacterium nitratireducens TaxID=518897 RepID=A0A917ZNM2_9GAMM|nr:NAD(P)H-hydrate dehydratase [Marinobacterium nitratireducens]GGO86043.1 bifunctional NAD(P)H-hydrate repair enzyme Nnr [Marinobacterium nitratireducens]
MPVVRTELPATLYTAEQSRALDRTAIEQYGLPGFKLMQRAGHAAFAALQSRWPAARSISVLCGSGNNGGDGFVVAGLAHQHGMSVQMLCIGDAGFESRLGGEALDAWRWAQGLGLTPEYFDQDCEFRGEVLIDAMLGTGLGGPVRGLFERAIVQCNRSPQPVLAVDIPSGLCSDTGAVQGVAVRADLTVTFIGLKQGLFTHEAVDYCGDIQFDGLLVPEAVYEDVPVSAFRTQGEDLEAALGRRPRSSHKGHFGHVMVIGGDRGFGGAAIMAAQAALRAGAGLVSLATRPEHVSAALTRQPELMVSGVDSGQDLEPLLTRPDILVLGPGLGRGAWGDQLLQQALATGKPMVVDADALNLLNDKGWLGGARRDNWILTPHPGEAARLLGDDAAGINSDRFESVQRLQARCGGVAVLKGAGTLTCDGDALHLCSAGNPGMAGGGMGDVLSGVIGGLWAQRLKAVDAARLGVFVHASAADHRARLRGERGLLATDLLTSIPLVIGGNKP